MGHGTDDPVKAAVALSLLGTTYDDFPNLIKSYDDKLRQEGLTDYIIK